MLALFIHWYVIWSARRQLTDLPENLRKDVGLTDQDIEKAARTPPWRAVGRPRC